MIRTVNQWCKDIHALARSKGWYEKTRSPLEMHMLIVSEVAEATEEVRNDRAYPIYQMLETLKQPIPVGHVSWKDSVKPEGELIELADAVIRIMDYCASKGWDLESAITLKYEFNKTRPMRHGGKAL